MSSSPLFQPLKIGDMEVKHRIGMAPMTRLRATQDRVPTPLMREYYGQRAAAPGTLIISEGTFVSGTAGGFPYAPGIWRADQVAGWRTITDRVHCQGSFIFCQLFAMGRAADEETASKECVPIIGPSAIPIDENAAMPTEMTIQDIERTVLEFVHAAENAIKAGFDGVEIHGANGYLLDQFIQDTSNQRDDKYGGTIGNRSRLINEVMQAVAKAIGPQRVGLRLSPWSTFQGMRMEDPVPQFSDVIRKASQCGIAYLHLVESRISGSEDHPGRDRLDFAYNLWNGPLLIAGGYDPREARELLNKKLLGKNAMVVFGRYFLANPDLVQRVKKDLELNSWDRGTFYVPQSPLGYTDYALAQR